MSLTVLDAGHPLNPLAAGYYSVVDPEGLPAGSYIVEMRSASINGNNVNYQFASNVTTSNRYFRTNTGGGFGAWFLQGTDRYVSVLNSTTTALDNGQSFVGEWEDVSKFADIVVAIKADQNGYYTVQFSPDGVNADSTLTRYYSSGLIEPPHRFAVTRQYFRVSFYNDSGANQTHLRLQTIVGPTGLLNTPIDATLAADYDAIVVRPTDYKHEIALGRRQGVDIFNKFAFNSDLDISTSPEILAAHGGTFTYLTTASTLTVSSTSTDDDDGGAGAHGIVIYGVDSDWDQRIEVLLLDGTTPVVSANAYFAVNRIAVFRAGASRKNVGTITATATTGGSVQATIPVGTGSSQQMIFAVPRDTQQLIEYINFNVVRFGSGTEPIVTFKLWVYSQVSNAEYEVMREIVDAAVTNTEQFNFPIPLVIGEKSICWITASTTRDDTVVSARLSFTNVADADRDP